MMSKCKNVLKIKLFLLAVIVFSIDLAYCSEQIYYSVHFATLRNLSDVNKQVNSINVDNALTVDDKKRNWSAYWVLPLTEGYVYAEKNAQRKDILCKIKESADEIMTQFCEIPPSPRRHPNVYGSILTSLFVNTTGWVIGIE